jgi:antitoxin PrlF
MEGQMVAKIEEISKITAKGQTTIPKVVRQALGVDYGDKIAFRVDARGVTLARFEPQEEPAIDHFLLLLANDIRKRPQAIKALSPELAARIAALVEDFAIDLDATIDGHITTLHPADHAVLIAALESPPPPTKNLRDAFAQHSQKIRSA